MSSHVKRRASINNGRKSRGPVTSVGRLHSDQARLAHGLTAKARCLPGEDLDQAAQFAQSLYDALQPQDAQQNHLAGIAIDAARGLDRCQRALNATLAEQIHTALLNIETLIEAEVARAIALFPKDPYAAVAALRGSSFGCQWLIKQWELLRQALLDLGFFTRHHTWLMLRLSGAAPVLKAKKVDAAEFMGLDVEKFHIEFHALFCRPTPPEASEVRTVFRSPAPGMIEAYQAQWPTREAHQAELLRRIDTALAELRAREASLRTGPEAVQKALAAEKALVIQDLPEGRSWVRYHGEHKSTYFRATKELQLLQDREADDEESAEDDEAPPEAVSAEADWPVEEVARAACDAAFPDDPKVQDSESQEADVPGTCDTDSGLYSEMRYRALKEALRKLEAAGFAEPCARGAPG
jgi:hypothetical protein